MQHLFQFFLEYTFIFYRIYLQISWKSQKAVSFNVSSVFCFCWIYHFYNVYPIMSVKLTLSSILSALLTWSVKQTSTEENSVLTVLIIVKEYGEIFTSSLNCLFETKVNKTFDVCWYHFWLNYSALKQLQQILILVHFVHLYLYRHRFLYFLTISLFHESAILICIAFLF